jgi:phosphoadenosine phosphosulfate reductase
MNIEQIAERIESYKSEGKKLFLTSSFQTHSIPLLHIISNIDKSIPVMFINTGYLFPDTLRYRDQVTKLLGLSLINIKSLVSRNLQRNEDGNLFFTSDPDRCCYLNKTQPMESVLANYDVWINGVRADQNTNRQNMSTEQNGAFSCKRFHPILDWNSKMIYEYIKLNKLPRHPLDDQGYMSIGCEPCTRKIDMNNDRDGRWFGLTKTECGLHTDLIGK